MHQIIGLKDLRQKMDFYAKRVKAGQSFVVVKKSRPLFSIHPVEHDEQWEEVIDFTKIKKNGVYIDEVLKRLKRL